MTALVNCEDSKLRAKHRSWDTHVSSKPMFRNQITIDQCDVEDAWVHLSINNSIVEFQELPVRLHRSLIKALRLSLRKDETP